MRSELTQEKLEAQWRLIHLEDSALPACVAEAVTNLR
jgi:hypothetical protein